ncbi:hypothetical protein GCM10007857_76850 [Bradyrhizobium iriomotense]|uniref:Uncharacterized protein n=1 Tax=Bradyrhizobium iriomotense TaxID=441950 RepID=A0ABQ6B9B9_9BRAD|nr:hypothetical protein GCM10007857_76850 [Bradyrhizobium iriomotense]
MRLCGSSVGRTRVSGYLLPGAELQPVQLLLKADLTRRLVVRLLPRTLQLLLLSVPPHPIVRIVMAGLHTTLPR